MCDCVANASSGMQCSDAILCTMGLCGGRWQREKTWWYTISILISLLVMGLMLYASLVDPNPTRRKAHTGSPAPTKQVSVSLRIICAGKKCGLLL